MNSKSRQRMSWSYLLFPFVMGSAPWVLLIIANALMSVLLAGHMNFTKSVELAMLGLPGGILNALYTYNTGKEDREFQIRALIVLLTGVIPGTIFGSIVAQKSTMSAADSSFVLVGVLLIGIFDCYMVGRRLLLHREVG